MFGWHVIQKMPTSSSWDSTSIKHSWSAKFVPAMLSQRFVQVLFHDSCTQEGPIISRSCPHHHQQVATAKDAVQARHGVLQ